MIAELAVSTHSRPKAADLEKVSIGDIPDVSTHSRPKAAEVKFYFDKLIFKVSTHSRPKAAVLIGHV